MKRNNATLTQTMLAINDPIPLELAGLIGRVEELLGYLGNSGDMTAQTMALAIAVWEMGQRTFTAADEAYHEKFGEKPKPPTAAAELQAERKESSGALDGLGQFVFDVQKQREQRATGKRKGLEWEWNGQGDWSAHGAKCLHRIDMHVTGSFGVNSGSLRSCHPTLALAKAWCEDQETKRLAQQATGGE